jgi:outer membrane protein OmpA-like peptidoglycan-associated protein
MTRADAQNVKIDWSVNGEKRAEQGRSLVIPTAGMATGTYLVEGHAYLASDPSVGQTCTTKFRLIAKAVPPPPVVISAPAPKLQADVIADFTRHMKDAYFKYNSAELLPEGYEAARLDAEYLNAHPALNVFVEGYTDERGNDVYNRDLGMKRADAMRDALIANGVLPSRIQSTTYGKEKAFCTARNESCFQRNRRAQVLLQP